MKGEPYDSWNEGRGEDSLHITSYPAESAQKQCRMRRGEATGNTQNRAQHLHTAPMEMIPKNGEKRKFHDLEKCEMKANLGDFEVKKQAKRRANIAYFALQCSLCSTSI